MEQPGDNQQPKVYLETYGCQMNIADSELIGGILRRGGYSIAAQPEQADVILLNTCAIREHAEERVLSRLSDLVRLRARRPGLRFGLLGCMAQHNRAALIDKAPYLDLVAGPDSYRRLPELLDQAAGDPVVDVRLDRAAIAALIVQESERKFSSFSAIKTGVICRGGQERSPFSLQQSFASACF